MSLATLARKTRAKQRLRTRGNFILNMTGRGNVLGMNAKMSRGNCKGLTKCAGKRAACCVGVGPQDNCNKIVVPTTQPDLNMVAAPAANPSSEYGFSALGNFYGDLTPASNLLNIDTTQTVNGGTLNVDPSIGATGTFYYVPGQLNTTASFTTITFVEKDTGASVSYYYSASVPYMGPGGGRKWTNSTAQKNFWNVFLNYTTFIKIFIDNTNPNVGPPYFSDPCCCQFKHGGKPAPQMGYGVYLNRKSKGAYHPGGGPQCCTRTESGKIVYKQPANISAGEVVEYKKTSTVACYHQTNNNSSVGSAHCASEGCTGKNTYIELYKYKMRVGSDDPTNPTEWGYDIIGSDTFGCLTPSTLLGYRIDLIDVEAFGNHELDLRIAAGETTTINKCSIKSLTLHDTATNKIETYYATNVLRFTNASSNSRWTWDGRNSFLPSKVGKCINMTIEVEKTKDITKPCLVRKNICGCRATDLVGYVRINHQRCSTTKTLPFNVTAGDQIVRKRGYTLCPKYGGTPKKPQMLGSCSGR